MAFSSYHHGLIDACISDALRDVLQLRSARADSAHFARQSAEDVLQAASAIKSVVEAAILQVYAEWNAAHCDPVIRLPRELAFECFRHLDFTGRRAITHVSRNWRQLALSDVRLWTTVSLPRHSPSVALDMLSAFLHRSNPMPFAVTSLDVTGLVPHAVLDLIIQHLHRIEFIKLSHLPPDDALRLFAQKATILRTLVFNKRVVLPSSWGRLSAPCLETLEVSGFSMPAAFQPMTSLRNFTGHLIDELPESFFEMFPNMTSLELHDVDQDALLRLDMLPPSLTRLSLHSMSTLLHVLDYSPFVPTLARLDLAYLFLYGASEVIDIVELFVRKTEGDRRMIVFSRQHLLLQSDASKITFEVITKYPLNYLPIAPAFLTVLRDFSSLFLPLKVLIEIDLGFEQGDRILSSLRSLTILIDWLGKYAHLRVSGEQNASPICLPQLQSLTFEVQFLGFLAGKDNVEEFATWLGHDFAAGLPLLISYPAQNVEFITLQTEYPDLLLQCGLDNLRRLGPRLKIRNLVTLDVTELLDDDCR